VAVENRRKMMTILGIIFIVIAAWLGYKMLFKKETLTEAVEEATKETVAEVKKEAPVVAAKVKKIAVKVKEEVAKEAPVVAAKVKEEVVKAEEVVKKARSRKKKSS
jgi:hypothetical protein